MTGLIIKTCLFVLFILNQITDLKATQDPEDSKTKILIYTEYAVDDFDFTWMIANFSQMYDKVKAEFSLPKSSTIWELKLLRKTSIELRRYDSGEPVSANINCTLISRNRTYHVEKFYNFYYFQRNTLELLDLISDCQSQSNPKPIAAYAGDKYENSFDVECKNLSLPIIFEDDVFKLKCSFKVVGPPITTVMNSSNNTSQN